MAQGEKILPHPDKLNNVEYGPFVLANLAAKRAKQIKEGAPPLVRIDSGHPLSIALAEIAAGKIKPIMVAEGAEVIESGDYSALEALDIADVGLLLPAIEEDIDLTAVGLEEEEVHEEAEDEDAVAELVDLLDVEEEVPAVTDDAEISLDDLAEQEEEGVEEDQVTEV
ncbi:MAG: DNA-directed RNA polymerase subunit omega [Armatimonadetes bacterium]|nr:DNA-directed RNA polymerase subunit omega [Armatimonadota bacterium]